MRVEEERWRVEGGGSRPRGSRAAQGKQLPGPGDMSPRWCNHNRQALLILGEGRWGVWGVIGRLHGDCNSFVVPDKVPKYNHAKDNTIIAFVTLSTIRVSFSFFIFIFDRRFHHEPTFLPSLLYHNGFVVSSSQVM